MSKEFSGIVKAWEFTVKKATAKKRAKKNIIFATMSVAHVDDDLDTPGEVYYAEKILNNGDIYTGQWSDNCPNGHGKYLWSDGCMYVGDWVKGKTMGKGKFSWPSGATYEGKFKNGYMDGEGIYTGCSNDTYRGSWVINMKHGKGTRDYVNGDHYEGEWRRGQPDGQGRYQWINGNQYIGQWRNGKMNGNGTMIWANGNRYDGSWEDGFPKGNGTFRWGDGSFYVGIWSKDTREQSGTYYPSSSRTGTFDWDPQDVHSNDLLGCQISPGERISVYPSQKMVSWPCEGEFLQKLPIAKTPKANKRNSVDGRLSNGDGYSWGSEADAGSNSVYSDQQRESSEGMRSFSTDDLDNSRGITPHCIKIQPNKKPGTTIAKGHKNYELMLNLQLGIRHSVGRPAPATSLDLRATAFDTKEKIWTKFPTEGSKHTPPHQSAEFKWKDYCPLVFRHSVGRPAPATSLDLRATAFDTKEKIWTKFPTEGSKHTPPHQSAEFKWKDYCPLVFRTLRKLFKVDPADYMISICGNDALRELSSPGKSGSFFYLTNDDKYMIKTLKKAEVKVLLGMLPAYYNHVRAFENTLVTKFFGLHCVKLTGPAQKKVRFVIMGNLFCTGYAIHRRFDLKGSSHGRVTEKPESQIDSTTTLKDLDLNFIFRLQKVWFQEFCRQVDRDCDFLEQERIMDYSLLVGVHFREVSGSGEPVTTETRSSGVRTPTANADQSSDGSTPRLSRADMDLLFDPSGWASIRLGINMPAKAELTVRRSDFESQLVGEPTGQYYDVVLFFSIIDILQNYDISKKLEHAYKAFQYDPTSISAVDPKQYSKRFRDFVLKVFAEDT